MYKRSLDDINLRTNPNIIEFMALPALNFTGRESSKAWKQLQIAVLMSK